MNVNSLTKKQSENLSAPECTERAAIDYQVYVVGCLRILSLKLTTEMNNRRAFDV
ncbi:MAG: hypothetical protein ACI8W7_001961 [Gammaproteobacteria bacterium]|jgi:hypothetical protein